MFVDRKDAFVL